jgi:hypothetical protein
MAVTVGDYEIVFLDYDFATGGYSQLREAHRPNAAIALPHPTFQRFQLRRKGQLIGASTSFSWYRAGNQENPFMPQFALRSDDYVLASLTTELSDSTAGRQTGEFPIAQLTLRNIAYRAVAGRNFRVYYVSEGPTGPNSFTVIFRTDGTFVRTQSQINQTTSGQWRITPSRSTEFDSGCGITTPVAAAGYLESSALRSMAFVKPDGTMRSRSQCINQYAIEPAG